MPTTLLKECDNKRGARQAGCRYLELSPIKVFPYSSAISQFERFEVELIKHGMEQVVYWQRKLIWGKSSPLVEEIEN